MQHLFLQQSYQDCYEAYQKSLDSEHYIQWDYVILTASNEAQAAVYREQIDYRLKEGYLSRRTKYAVLPDPEGKRVGSGGATLNVLRYVAEDVSGESSANPFAGKRILVIHSGGDSKRVPQYSVCGKLFSPVPRKLPDGRNSTLFDEFIISMAGVAGRLGGGMLVLSGDVLLLFNPLQIDFTFNGAAALSVKEPVSVGKNHGVFLNDGKDYVKKFLHKQSEAQLQSDGAVNSSGLVDLDTGAVALDTNLMQALFSLISKNGRVEEEKFDQFVNETARLSFYGDFLYPLATEATLEDYYKEAGENDACEELRICRRAVWETISDFSLRLLSLSPAEFIHFGTTGELVRLVTKEVDDYRFLGWMKQVGTNVSQASYAAHNSLIEEGARIGEDAYLEDSVLHDGARVGSGCVISGVELRGGIAVPAGTVLHGLRLQDGRYVVRSYGVEDNPKDCCKELMSGTILQEIGADTPFWEADVFPVADTPEEAVEAALIAGRMMQGSASAWEEEWWLKQEKISLCGSFNRADAGAGFDRKLQLQEHIEVQNAVKALCGGLCWEEVLAAFGKKGITEAQRDSLKKLAGETEFSTAMRIYYLLAEDARRQGLAYEGYEEACFGVIRNAVFESVRENVRYRGDFVIRKDEVHIELPVRVNWGGGWSDTPPHCLEKGGTVVNAAIKLNGNLPVQVTVRRTEDFKIEVVSEDVGAYGEIVSLSEIWDCNNPYDAFALHKAALLACGVVPMPPAEREEKTAEQIENADLQDILRRLGGGLFISTQVIGIPKGSGLGTSSILAGACVKALFELMGEAMPDDALYGIVLCMEQIMSTGGGWQDQVGGITPGIKYITTEPGLKQHIKVEQIAIPEAAKLKLQERFALIYTGQRRLARNLLRDVVGNYIGNRKESLDALYKMQRIAALMRFELEKGNIDELAMLLNVHWEISKELDEGSSNTCIDQIFRVCEDLIAGRFIAGAGGGGFLQVILKQGVTKKQLRDRLHQVFQDSGADVWESEFYY